MSADMAGPGGRSGFGFSPRDGDRRSPLKGENHKVLSGGELMDWKAKPVPYEQDPLPPGAAPPPRPRRRPWPRRMRALFRRRRDPAPQAPPAPPPAR